MRLDGGEGLTKHESLREKGYVMVVEALQTVHEIEHVMLCESQKHVEHATEHAMEHATEHAMEHATEHAMEHAREHAREHLREHAREHLREHAMEHVTEHATEHATEQDGMMHGRRCFLAQK